MGDVRGSAEAKAVELLNSGDLRDRDPEAEAAERRAETILETWRELFATRALFTADRERAAELRDEGRPTVHALLLGAALETAGEPTSLEHHEAVAMTSLLGRRLAILGITPGSARRTLPALAEAFVRHDAELPAELLESLADALTEGYVRGGLERADDERLRRAATQVPTLDFGDGVLGLVLAGEHDPECLGERLEEFGRELFRREARGVLVDLAGLANPSRALAHVVFGLEPTARMLGLRLVFSGANERWRERLADLSRTPDAVTFADTLGAALAAARAPRGLRGRLGRLLPSAR